MKGWDRVKRKLRQGDFGELKKEISWLMQYVRRYKKAIGLYSFLGVLGVCLGLAGSVFSKYVIDAVTQYDQSPLIHMGTLYVVIGFCGIGQNCLMSRMLAKVSLKINSEILSDVYREILNTKWEDMTAFHSGDLLNRTNGDVSTIGSSVLGWIPNLLMKSVHFLGSLCIILYYDPMMALIALCSAPITVVVSRVLLWNMREQNKRMLKASSDMMGFTQESFQHMQSIKAFHLVDLFGNRLRSVQKRYIQTAMEYNLFTVSTSAFLSVMSLCVSLFCMGWGVYRLWTGHITYGTMVLFLQLAKTLSSDFQGLIKLVPSAVRATTSAGRIMEVTGLSKEEEGNRKQIEKIEQQADRGVEIQLKNVTFFYQRDKVILENCSFYAKPGEVIGLVGESGVGKTTLMRILLGLLNPVKGSAIIRDQEGNEEELGPGTRRFFSYVPQGNTVFSGTIDENLRMIKPEASDEELEHALRAACAWKFVSSLPDGIKSKVGEQGLGLSEGQSQRIAIARAILKKAPIILFDEGTSALDEKTGQEVLNHIREAAKSSICILASHRESALKFCDRIYRIEACRVIESER